MPTTTDIPEQARSGRVMFNAVRFLADGGDVGARPDQAALGGFVTLTASPRWVRWPTADPPRLSEIAVLPCPILGDGDLYPPRTTEETRPDEPGVSLTASPQPEAEPNYISWWASFALTVDGELIDPQPPPVRFDVPDGETLDLTHVVPVPAPPSVTNMVSSADRIAAEAAAAHAQGSADAAATAADVATTSRDVAVAAATQAGAFAADSDQASQAAHAARDGAVDAAGSAAGAASSATAYATAAGASATTATTAATTATTAATTATGAADQATTAATQAATSRDVASTAATTATDAATTATTARDEAQAAATTAVEAAESVHGLRIFLVPNADWPPADDPNPLHWYLRVADEPTPTTEAL